MYIIRVGYLVKFNGEWLPLGCRFMCIRDSVVIEGGYLSGCRFMCIRDSVVIEGGCLLM